MRYLRVSSERAFLCFRSNCRESIGNDGDEQIKEPEIDDDDTDDEEDA